MNEFVKEKDEASPEGDESTFNMRVRSWLRMNAGGVPNTCKSSEALLIEAFGWKMRVTERRRCQLVKCESESDISA